MQFERSNNVININNNSSKSGNIRYSGEETSEDIPLSPTTSSVLISRLPRRLDVNSPPTTVKNDAKQQQQQQQQEDMASKDSLFTIVVLTTINLINYMDRYVPSAAKSSIMHELDLTDAESSLPLTGFIIVYMISSPLFGFLADSGKISRLKLIAFGIVFWSVTTMLTGTANDFASYLVLRSLVGFGESAYASIVPSILSGRHTFGIHTVGIRIFNGFHSTDMFPPEKRNVYLTVFQAAAPVGAAMGFGLGGFLSDKIGWRWMFVFSGIPGLLLTMLLFCLDDPPRGRYDEPPLIEERRHKPSEYEEVTFDSSSAATPSSAKGGSAPREVDEIKNKVMNIASSLPSLRETLVVLMHNEIYVYCVVGQILVTWAAGGLADWLPTYFEREFGVSPTTAGLATGGATVAGGLFGTITGGRLGDALVGKTHLPYMAISALGLVPSTVLAFLAILVARTQFGCTVAVCLAQFFMWWYNGPIT